MPCLCWSLFQMEITKIILYDTYVTVNLFYPVLNKKKTKMWLRSISICFTICTLFNHE